MHAAANSKYYRTRGSYHTKVCKIWMSLLNSAQVTPNRHIANSHRLKRVKENYFTYLYKIIWVIKGCMSTYIKNLIHYLKIYMVSRLEKVDCMCVRAEELCYWSCLRRASWIKQTYTSSCHCWNGSRMQSDLCLVYTTDLCVLDMSAPYIRKIHLITVNIDVLWLWFIQYCHEIFPNVKCSTVQQSQIKLYHMIRNQNSAFFKRQKKRLPDAAQF